MLKEFQVGNEIAFRKVNSRKGCGSHYALSISPSHILNSWGERHGKNSDEMKNTQGTWQNDHTMFGVSVQ